MPALRLLAGPTAYKTLSEQGLKPELFSQLLAASGGPKWLGIAGVDKYLFGEFFKDRQAPLYTLGASSGAWRLACLAQQAPLEAYARLEDFYIGQRYETKPSREAVTAQVQLMVQGILGDKGAAALAGNGVIRSHLLVCRGRHLNRAEGRLALTAGLAGTAMSNLVSRKTLGWHFERFVFSQQDPASPFACLQDLPSRQASLTRDNAAKVMLATGSIPLLLAPVTEIPGVEAGHYYDGGITDYHFDLPLSHAPGLTLYPHFYPKITPGWFDKSLGWRRAGVNYDNALILTPSAEFIASLPFAKIPDREDFKALDSESRMAYWRQAAAMSERLAEELDQIITKGTLTQCLEPFV